jgi:signal transduction histidine kinase
MSLSGVDDGLPQVTTTGSTARHQLGLAVVATIIIVVVAGGAAPLLLSRNSIGDIETALTHGQAALLFGAASLGLLSGRWVARTSVGFACSALLVLAFAGAVSGTVGQTGFIPVLYTGGAAIAVLLLLAAAAAPDLDDLASFRRLLNRESGPTALLALVALTPVVDALLVADLAMPVPARLVFPALVAAGWLVAGIKVLRLERPRLKWLPAVLGILAAEAVVRSFGGAWSESLLIAIGLKALAGSFALVGAGMAARAAFVSTTDGMTSMLQDLNAMQDEDGRRRAEESDRLHEVRSVLAGLQAATGSLRKYEDSIDPEVRRRLEDAVGAELTRLNHLIDPRIPEVTIGLDLEGVVMSVVMAEREQGLVITTDLANVSVQGSTAEIATLVSDLLVNARVHALGSAVLLTARTDGEVISLSVRDWGPGLSTIEAARVFERSFRGARPLATGIPGSGLGLHNARKLARQMQGDLQVRAPEGGGCCFVATLPVSRSYSDDQVLENLEGDLAIQQPLIVKSSPRHDVRTHQRKGMPL